jgi:hypothetical protein
MVVVSQGYCRIVIVVRWFNSSKMGLGAGELNGRKNRSSALTVHKDRSVKAKGCAINGVLTGYWKWFGKDGTKMRSGYLKMANRHEWTTYDARGKAGRVTKMKSPR